MLDNIQVLIVDVQYCPGATSQSYAAWNAQMKCSDEYYGLRCCLDEQEFLFDHILDLEMTAHDSPLTGHVAGGWHQEHLIFVCHLVHPLSAKLRAEHLDLKTQSFGPAHRAPFFLSVLDCYCYCRQ